DGLRAAHDRGVIHRDLKPHNIMIEERTERVVLMDFGLARLDDGRREGDSSGTPAFMAPEQVRGDPVGARADLYALGCVVYYMVVGEVVFPAESPQVMMQRHVADPPPALPAPPRLAKLVRRLLAKQPGERPSAADVVAALSPSRRWWAIAAVLVVAAVAVT